MAPNCQKRPDRPVVPLDPASFQPRQPDDWTHKHERENPEPGLHFDLCDGTLQ